uniref:Uncharacterized protein n=1 Tax=Parastrongyloides trichosuri TaxID=131310 RepID=A0A0N4ZDW9_PARTI
MRSRVACPTNLAAHTGASQRSRAGEMQPNATRKNSLCARFRTRGLGPKTMTFGRSQCVDCLCNPDGHGDRAWDRQYRVHLGAGVAPAARAGRFRPQARHWSGARVPHRPAVADQRDRAAEGAGGISIWSGPVLEGPDPDRWWCVPGLQSHP